MRSKILPKPPVKHSGLWFYRTLIEQYGGAR